jgi:hypothetical protein
MSNTADSPPKPTWAATPVWALIAAFGAYFCMYGFRKPFTAAGYTDWMLWGIGYKAVLVTSQTLGYALSKWVGIKIISEIKPEQRATRMLLMIGIAQLALLGFGLTPFPWNFAFLFLNGFPLGMVFGLVQGYLEGRRSAEALIAGLCASFILADGVTKSVGAYLLEGGVSESWMPFTAGLVFALPLLLFVWMLSQVPKPSEADVAMRAERVPMDKAARRAFFAKYRPGLIALSVAFLLVTILRSIRADFAPELWSALGFNGKPAVFTQSELYVMFGVTLLNGLSIFIADNRRAFLASQYLSLLGFALILMAWWGLGAGMGGFWYMVLIGLGLYLPYVAVHTTVFERMIAMTREKANIGFLMYTVDTIGYVGYIMIMLFRGSLKSSNVDFLAFYNTLAIGASVISIGATAFAVWYFSRVAQR